MCAYNLEHILCFWSVQIHKNNSVWMSSIVTMCYIRMSLANIYLHTTSTRRRKHTHARTHFNRLLYLHCCWLFIEFVRREFFTFQVEKKEENSKWNDFYSLIRFVVVAVDDDDDDFFPSSLSTHSISIQCSHLPCHYCLIYLSTHLRARAIYIVCIQ